MARISREERREALRRRQQRAKTEHGQTGLGRKSIIDLSRINEKRTVGRYEVKSGKDINCIDILPFEVTQEWYKDLRGKPGSATGIDVGYEDYKLEVPIHTNVGENNDIFLCLKYAFGKRCPLCEEVAPEWDKPKAERDEKIMQACRVAWKTFYNIYDYEDPDAGYQVWVDVSYGNFEKVLLKSVAGEDEGVEAFADLEDGKTLEFRGSQEEFAGNKYIEAERISFLDREPYDESVLDETISFDALVHIPTYEEVATAHLGVDPDEDAPVTTSRSRGGRSKRKEPEEQEEPRSRRSRGRAGKEEEQEDVCPADGEWGVDCNQLSACDTCDEAIFQACAALQDDLKKEAAEKEEEPEKPTRRGRSRAKEEDTEEPEESTSSRRRPNRSRGRSESTGSRSRSRRSR